MTPDQLERIRERAPEAVLLPIRKGSKAPSDRAWQQTTLAATRTPQYEKRLLAAPAIGILVGQPSGGICSIDCDDDAFLDEILAMNPILAGTLRTKGRRGGNLWVAIEGEFPHLKKLSDPEAGALGEWRADGGQTIILGGHVAGGQYEWVVDAPPVRIAFDEIRWPRGFFAGACVSLVLQSFTGFTPFEPFTPFTSHQEEGAPAPAPPTVSGGSLAARIAASEQARENILRDKTIGPHYRKYIDHIGVGQGSRNTKLCQVAGFAPDIAFRLGMALYDVNADRFIDSREQHEGELIAILSDADRRWRERLSPSEREVIDGHDEERTAAYRICRTLAGIANDYPPPLFHLSCEELGKRIGKHGQQSHRILESFVAHGILAIHQKGTRREAGARGVATVYRWLQPLSKEVSDTPVDPSTPSV